MTPRQRYTSETEYVREMEVLAASAWQFVCMSDDLAHPNDWVRSNVFGTDLFVQNFSGEIRGYHNVCQHRGFPLRRAPRGHGPVQCGFHGWVYNRDGIPTGVPRNQELFGLSREQLAELAIPAIRVATVGRFVFVAVRESVPTIEQYLGRYHDVLIAISLGMRSIRHRHEAAMRANWKLCFEVTLDDYHLQMIHPSTFGAGEPSPLSKFFYGREGRHSYLFKRRDDDWTFATYWDDIQAGRYDFTGYKIHQIFPDLLVATHRHLVLVTAFRPRAASLTVAEDTMVDLATNGPAEEHALEASWAAHRQVHSEDVDATEAQQEIMAQHLRAPMLGKLEERVGWFRDTCAELFDDT